MDKVSIIDPPEISPERFGLDDLKVRINLENIDNQILRDEFQSLRAKNNDNIDLILDTYIRAINETFTQKDYKYLKLFVEDLVRLLLFRGKPRLEHRERRTGSASSWRERVLRRDEYTCQECGVSGPNVELHAHHIEPVSLYPERAEDLDNGQTLCRECHMKTASWGC